MKFFKPFLNVIVALILLLSLFGCSKTSSNEIVATDSSAGGSDSSNNTADSSKYIFPESDKVLLTESELNNLPVKTLELGRNEIFARHGYVFKTEEFKKYFSEKTWYKANDNFSEKDLNSIEAKNVSLIKSIEDKKTNKSNTTKTAGKTYGRIREVSEDNGTKYVSFDKVEWLTYDDVQNRQDVKDHIIKEYGSMPSQFENDYYVYNADTNLTKLQFSNNGFIINWKSDDTGITTFLISFDDFKNNSKQNGMAPQDGVYCITTENNTITKLEKMYQP